MFVIVIEKYCPIFAKTAEELTIFQSKKAERSEIIDSSEESVITQSEYVQPTELIDAAALEKYLLALDNLIPDDSLVLGERSAVVYFLNEVAGRVHFSIGGYSEVIEIPFDYHPPTNNNIGTSADINVIIPIVLDYFF